MSPYSKSQYFFLFPLTELCEGFLYVGKVDVFIATILGYIRVFHHYFFPFFLG